MQYFYSDVRRRDAKRKLGLKLKAALVKIEGAERNAEDLGIREIEEENPTNGRCLGHSM